MNNYVTHLNKYYLPQAMCLYKSLIKFEENFQLFVILLDEYSFKFFSKNNFPSITPILFREHENDRLLQLKASRKPNEYFWTITPYIQLLVYNIKKDLENLTYLDADTYFFSKPSLLLNSFYQSSSDILITKHNFSEEYKRLENNGKYCVQFIASKASGKDILNEWNAQCLEWCFDRVEKDRFGDQKYLDAWQEKYGSRVFIPKNRNLFQGPWNVDSCDHKEAILYHFHGLRLLNKNKILANIYYKISDKKYNFFYKQYLIDFKEIIRSEKLYFFSRVSLKRLLKFYFLSILNYFKKYNVIHIETFK